MPGTGLPDFICSSSIITIILWSRDYVFPILQVRTLRHKEVKWLVQSLNSVNVALTPRILNTRLYCFFYVSFLKTQLLSGWVLAQVIWLPNPRVCSASQRPREINENLWNFCNTVSSKEFKLLSTQFSGFWCEWTLLNCQFPSKEKQRASAKGHLPLAGAPSRWRYPSRHQLAAQSPGLTASAESFPVLPHSLLSPPPHGARAHVTSRRPMGEQRGRAGPCGRH